MPLVVPGICRFTLHGTMGGHQWANIFDMHIESGGIGTRDNNVKDQAKIFLNEYIDHISPLVSSVSILEGCRWVDLDTAGGTTGDAVVATSPRGMPNAGDLSGDALPASVALLSRKVVQAGRGKRKGRSYWIGCTEANSGGNGPATAHVTAWTTGLGDFLSGVSQSGATSFGGYDSHMVVTHVSGSGAVSHDDVTVLQPQTVWATQRRRIRG